MIVALNCKAFIWLHLWLIAIAPVVAAADKSADMPITGVQLDRYTFDPARGQTIGLSYAAAKPARIKIEVFDPDGS